MPFQTDSTEGDMGFFLIYFYKATSVMFACEKAVVRSGLISTSQQALTLCNTTEHAQNDCSQKKRNKNNIVDLVWMGGLSRCLYGNSKASN